MKTSFSIRQLQDPALAEADAILRSCEHYGFCTAGCPTYVLLGDENDAPRGRIDLIKDMLERGGAPAPKTVQHIDRCLSCLSCMTTCAVRVDYRHLVDRARSHIERHHRRGWDEWLVRRLLVAVLPHPRRMRWALGLARGAALPWVRGLMRALPRRLAQRVAPLLEMTPAQPLPREPALIGEHPCSGTRRGRVLLLAGCAQRALAPSINDATVRMLNRAGLDVGVVAEAGCCGSLELHLGMEVRAKQRARRNVRAWLAEIERAPVQAIVINASGCGSTVKDYGHLLAQDAELSAGAARIAELARDICELLAEADLPPPAAPQGHAVAVHDPCSLRNVQRITEQPRALLRRAGFSLREIAEGHFCCGSAGTYNLLQPDLAQRLGQRKAAHALASGAQMVAAANIGCVVQMSRYASLPVVHPIELLDWAWGGPRPRALLGVEPAPAAQTQAQATAAAGQDAAAFW